MTASSRPPKRRRAPRDLAIDRHVEVVLAGRGRPAARERPAEYPSSLPGPLYCDSSALLKLYLPEAGSDEFNRAVEGRDDLLVADLAVTEIVSAVGRRARDGELRPAEAVRIYRAIVAALDQGLYRHLELTRPVHRQAERFLLSPGGAPLRAADALHLALALSAGAASMATFDARLGGAARLLGLAIYPR